MSALRPYETDPFHPHSSVHIQYEKQFLYICKSIPVVCPMWYSHCVFVRCAFCFVNVLFYKLLLKSSEPFGKSFSLLFGTYYSVSVRNTYAMCALAFF